MSDLNCKPSEYYMLEREELILFVPYGAHRVLELGCAEGNTGARLKVDGRAAVVVGLELNPEVALRAQAKLDYVLCGNIEHADVPAPYGLYDYILAGDVLEHLIDPWSTLKKLKGSLKPTGKIIFSVPNLRNWTVLFPLLFNGKWEYQNFGIMDSTHLRFFTKKSCIALVKSAEMSLISITPAGSKIANKLHKLHMSTLVELAAVQFVVVCENK